ncbi:HlyD family secretion protein [Clostridium sp. USBA 49]|jgi:HlyD family secretion protein|uniref:efflux RND transporter periplasmic adaptor subunit n=1 Tax=Clostridium TaxID=1485 RepID=UPI00099AED3B|nr:MULTISPECIES: efflux RND transporter periplasmic adaptor subunit [Clostridium]SKA82786.1 HlyD family secretion protein [Clostridium sp. USBA 49]
MKKKITISIVIIFIVGGILYLNLSKKNEQNFVSVKTSVVEQGEIKSYLSTTATIKSKNSKDYYPLQGKVKKVNVKLGDKVTKGQVLVEYETQDLNSAVKQAQIQYDNAVLSKKILTNNNNDIKNKIADLNKQIADLDNKIAELDKQIKNIQESGSPQDKALLLDSKNPQNPIVIKQNVESSKAQLKATKDSLKPISDEQFKQADNSIELAKVALDSAKQNLSKVQDKIISDIDGVVTSLNITEGTSSIASAQPAITIQDVENLKAVMYVGKYDAGKIKEGQEAIIKSGDKEYKGKVSFIDPTAKKTVSATGTDTSLGVDIDILDKAQELKIDFDVDVDILLGQVDNALKIPAESIKTTKEDKTFVYVIEGDKAVEKEVKLGLQSDMEVQVLEGLNKGEKVILNPSETIKNGTLVKESSGDDK